MNKETYIIALEAEAQIYSSKLSLFESYVNRAWQRFNWLVTINFAWLSIIISNYDKIKIYYIFLYFWSISGVILALIWIIMGYEDNHSIHKYGKEIRKFEEILLKKIDVEYLNIKITNNKWKFRQTNWLYLVPFVFGIFWIIVVFLIYYRIII